MCCSITRYCKRSFLILVIIFNCSIANAQITKNVPYRVIDESNRLSDNNVTCIYKDNTGFLWIGTASGLDLLDGSTITVFKNSPADTNSISNNYIQWVTQDSSGFFWVGTKNGLNKFDFQQRKFSTVAVLGYGKVNNDGINEIAVDPSNNLYVTNGKGLFFYDRKKNIAFPIELPGIGIDKAQNNHISHIAFDKNYTLWISTFNGLWSYSIKTHQIKSEINRENDKQFAGLYTNFIFDRSGNIWLGTWNSGLKEFNPQTKTVRSFALPNANFEIIALQEIIDNNGKDLIIINNQLLCFDKQTNKFISRFPGNISANTFYFFTDGLFWVGTKKGIVILKLGENYFQQHLFPNELTSQNVALQEWKNNLLVGGENKNFLKLYDKNLEIIGDFSNHILFKKIDCLSLFPDGEDDVVCGTTEGIAHINLKNNSTQFYHLHDTTSQQNLLNFISFIFKDSFGQWWIFPWRNGIWKSDADFLHPKKVFSGFLKRHGVQKQLVIAAACEDQNRNLWFGDYDEGIIFYKRKTNTFSKPFVSLMGEFTNASQVLYYKNYCYSFSASNILKWNTDSLILHTIPVSQVTDKDITSMALDSLGNLWLSTDEGLVVYNQVKKIFRHFTIADGLPANKMEGNLFCGKNGTMYFGSVDYLLQFQPEKVLASIEKIPAIRLTELLVNNQIQAVDESRKHIFSPNAHNFIFAWSILSFADPLNNKYYYQLKGVDKNWRFAGNMGRVEFVNLSPGHYTLLLKGENENGISANKILQFDFTIQLPFWKTTWFVFLIIALMAIIFYGLYRYRINHIRKLEALRNRISLNLHDDIGSTLSSISILSALALHKEKNRETQDILETIKNNAISLMDEMDDIVWSINPRNDSLHSLFLRIRSFAAKLFEAKNINYKIEIPNSILHIKMTMQNRQHLYLILKEAINNLIKYSACSEAGIAVNFHKPLLSISIEDNGKGFSMNKDYAGNGLKNMKKRADALGANLKIQSKDNEGTKVNLTLKIK